MKWNGIVSQSANQKIATRLSAEKTAQLIVQRQRAVRPAQRENLRGRVAHLGQGAGAAPAAL